MRLCQRAQVSRTNPLKVLLDLIVLVLIWQPGWLFPLTPASAAAAALPWFIIQKIISALWGSWPQKGLRFPNPACFGYVFGMAFQLSFGLKHPGGAFPGSGEWWCWPSQQMAAKLSGLRYLSPGKRAAARTWPDTRLALCCQALPWWQGLRVKCSIPVFCNPSHCTSCPAPSVTESPESKAQCLSLVTTEKGEISLRDIKRTKVLKIVLLNGL